MHVLASLFSGAGSRTRIPPRDGKGCIGLGQRQSQANGGYRLMVRGAGLGLPGLVFRV